MMALHRISQIDQLWNAWRAAEGCFASLANSNITFYDLLPPTPSFVSYMGSLTTPPCYEVTLPRSQL